MCLSVYLYVQCSNSHYQEHPLSSERFQIRALFVPASVIMTLWEILVVWSTSSLAPTCLSLSQAHLVAGPHSAFPGSNSHHLSETLHTHTRTYTRKNRHKHAWLWKARELRMFSPDQRRNLTFLNQAHQRQRLCSCRTPSCQFYGSFL